MREMNVRFEDSISILVTKLYWVFMNCSAIYLRVLTTALIRFFRFLQRFLKAKEYLPLHQLKLLPCLLSLLLMVSAQTSPLSRWSFIPDDLSWTFSGLEISPRDVALLCQKVENYVVGAPCGVMDQMASACGEANKLLAMICQVLFSPLFIPIKILE